MKHRSALLSEITTRIVEREASNLRAARQFEAVYSRAQTTFRLVSCKADTKPLRCVIYGNNRKIQ
jgi:hypothetical protein